MARYKIVDAPTLQPAVDYVTGSGVGPFVDTGRDITFGERKLGRIYLSKSTVAEMAHELGLSKTVDEGALHSAYAQGKLDGLMETLDGDILRVVNTLERWLDGVRTRLAEQATAEID